MTYEARIAWRHLQSKKRSSVSVITLICTLGVVLGVAALVTVMSVAGGFQEAFRSKVLGHNGHILVMKYGIDFGEYRDVMARARRAEGVLGATPFIFHEMVLSAGAALSGVLVKGVNPETVGDVTELPRCMTSGRVESLVGGGRPTLVIGEELAASLGVGVGDPVTLVSPLRGLDPRSWGPRGARPSNRTFTVSGLFRSGFNEYDGRLVYAHLASIQDFFGQGDTVTGVELKVADIHATRRISRSVRQSLGDQRYVVKEWREVRPALAAALDEDAKGLRGVVREVRAWLFGGDPPGPPELEGVPHVTIVRDDGPFLDWRNAVQEAEFLPDVRAAGPVIRGRGELRAGGGAGEPVPVDIAGHSLDAGVTDYRTRLVAGTTDGMDRLVGAPGERTPGGVLLEEGFARSRAVKVGDRVTLTVTDSDDSDNLPGAVPVELAVVGLVGGDEAVAWLDFTAARRMLSTLDAAGGVEVRLRAPLRSEAVAKVLRSRLGGHAYRTLDWREINQNLFKSLALQKFVLTLIVFFMVVVAMFNIVSTLFIVVIDKGREIAILKSMGATSWGVLRVFVLEGAAIGVVGTAAGLLLGGLACAAIGALDYGLDAKVYLIDTLPVRPEAAEFASAGALALAASLLATIPPAARAALLPPVEALRRS